MSGTRADQMFFDEDAFKDKPMSEEMKNAYDGSLFRKTETQGKPIAEFTEEMKEEFIKGVTDPLIMTAKQEEKKNRGKVVIGSEIGNIYYQYVEETDSFDLFRITKIQNGNTVTCMINGDPKNTKKFNLLELKKNYPQLCSNYVMTVSRVSVGVSPTGEVIEDIVIMLYKRTASDTEFTAPDVVCRQGISDVFYEPYCNQKENPMVGVSITPETTPAGYEFKHFYEAFDNILDSVIINLYMTDTLDTIVSLIRPSKWDDIPLNLLKARHKYKCNNDFMYSIKHKADEIPDEVDGYCKDVKTLLKTNNFMYDFYALYRIVEVTFKIEWNDDGINYPLPEDQKEALQDLYEVNMDKTIVGPYDYSIDLDTIKMPYVLVVDNTGVLYIIGYTRSANEYVKVVDTSITESIATINEQLAKIVNVYNKYSE